MFSKIENSTHVILAKHVGKQQPLKHDVFQSYKRVLLHTNKLNRIGRVHSAIALTLNLNFYHSPRGGFLFLGAGAYAMQRDESSRRPKNASRNEVEVDNSRV